jgi:hypothetical protein
MPFDDQELRERFAALRGEDAERAPDFAELRKRRSPPRPSWRARAAVVAALAVVVVLLFMHYRRPSPPPESSITEWRSPTEFLLQTPGRELLERVPAFAQGPASMANPAGTPTPFKRKG